jgi:RNA polymerase sigma factor (sigma-70 family)
MKRGPDLSDPLFIETYRLMEKRKYPSPFDALVTREQDAKIRKVLSQLTPREEYILTHRMRDGNHRTLDDLAAEFGISRERIRQIQAKAQRKFNFKLTHLKGG